MEMPETQQVEKNTYQIKNINGETFVIHVDNNDEKKFTKIAQITSDGDLIPQNITRVIGWSPNSLNISNEAEIKKNKVKIIAIISACCLAAILATLYTFYSLLQERIKTAEINAKIRQEELADQERRVEEERQAETKKAEEELKRRKEVEARKVEEERKTKEAEVKKAEEERKAKEAEAKKAEAERKAKEAEAKKAEAERKKQEAEREEKRKAEAAKREQHLKGRKIGNLIWSDRSSNKMNWSSAKKYCEDLTEGGYTDWRLPNIDELRTLIQNHSGTQSGGSCPISEKAGKLAWSDRTDDCNGIIGSNFSKLGDTDWFWSSSVHSANPYYRWLVYFYYGHVSDSNVAINNYVRCVR